MIKWLPFTRFGNKKKKRVYKKSPFAVKATLPATKKESPKRERVKKLCRGCNKIKPILDFYVQKRAGDGHSSQCKVCLSKILKEYENTHQEERKAYSKRHYAENKEKLNEYVREYNKRKPEVRREISRRYRHKKRANGGDVSNAEWETLKQRYGYMCLRCERTDVKLTQDHIVPVHLGGKYEIENIQPLCQSCNSTKRTTIIDYRIKFINL